MSDPKRDPIGDGTPSRDPPAGEIRAQMRRILSAPEFAQSHQLQKFLQFVVEETLAGQMDGLKEYTIALEVFERDSSFDPQLSSVVPVEASRLRAKLKQYYADAGRDDPVHIVLPTGNYVPIFSRPEPDGASKSDPLTTRGRTSIAPARIAMIAVGLVLLIGASAFFLFDGRSLDPRKDRSSTTAQTAQEYSVAVLPLRNLLGKPELDYFSDSMTSVLITSLATQRKVRVILLTSAMAYKNVNRPIATIARELNVEHVVEGAMFQVGERIRISLQLIETATSRHIWAENYVRDKAEVLTIQDDVVRHIVAKLSGKAATEPGVGQKSALLANSAA